MKYYILAGAIVCLAVILIFGGSAQARHGASVKFSVVREENPRGAKNRLIVPYIFSSESMGTTVGVAAGTRGYGQDQLLVGGTAFASADDAVGGVLAMLDYMLPWTERLFFSWMGSPGHYPRQRGYASRFRFPDVTNPSSNDSEKERFYKVISWKLSSYSTVMGQY